MGTQEQFTKEDFAAMLERHKNEIRNPPTQEHAAKVVTSRFTEEEWQKWHNTQGGAFSDAWKDWACQPAGYIQAVNIASDLQPQSRCEKEILYQIPDLHSPESAGSSVPYKHFLTGTTIGYTRPKTYNPKTRGGTEIPEGCKYLGHTYGEETAVHVPSQTAA